MRCFKLRQGAVWAAALWILLAASVHAQQSIGDAMRADAVVSSPVPVEANGLPSPPASVEDALHSLFERAGVVFTGEVISVKRTGYAVLVTFRVEDGIRGVASGGTYLLREWAGLWVDDPSRYVVGERRLMLLHANSVCGFASPVAGAGGAVRLHGNAVQGTADLRWVAAQVAVTGATPMVSAFAKTSRIPQASEDEATVTDGSAMDGAVVTAMLHAWQSAEAAQ